VTEQTLQSTIENLGPKRELSSVFRKIKNLGRGLQQAVCVLALLAIALNLFHIYCIIYGVGSSVEVKLEYYFLLEDGCIKIEIAYSQEGRENVSK
jgi:hypothetical protein